MNTTMSTRLLHLSFCVAVTALFCGADWAQFRGPGHRGVATDTNLPTDWSAKETFAWKADLPGRGASSPIVVKGRVVVTCSSGVKQDRLHVLCFDAKTGKRLWQREFWATGRTMTHRASSVAAPTPTSDGRLIYAFFSSNDLICLDLDGNLRWLRGLAHDYPKAGNDIGMSASPLLVGDTVIVQIENQGDSFAAGIDAQTGKSRWRIERDHRANWCSPTLLSKDGSAERLVLLQSPSGLTAIDAKSGKSRWKYESQCAGITSCVSYGGSIFVPSQGVKAIGRSADGKVKLLWKSSKLNPGAASPVVNAGRIYTVSNAGVLACGNASSGEVLWQLRLKGRFWATPVMAGDYLYFINSKGLAQIVQTGDKKATVVSTYDFGEGIQGSPAVADGAMYVRSDKRLWKIAGK
jgi:outer membrane protein assembly factor BamB